MDEMLKLMQMNKRSYIMEIRQTIGLLDYFIMEEDNNKVSEQQQLQHKLWDLGILMIERI